MFVNYFIDADTFLVSYCTEMKDCSKKASDEFCKDWARQEFCHIVYQSDRVLLFPEVTKCTEYLRLY